MDKERLDANELAYKLAARLQEETHRFLQEYHTATTVSVVGAANVYLASLMINLPSKAMAMTILESDFDVIRSILLNTPDEMFVNPNVELSEKREG